MNEALKQMLSAIPRQEQRKDSNTKQLRDLSELAARLGMQDAKYVLKLVPAWGLGGEHQGQLELAWEAHRERCIEAVLAERVDAEATGEESDRAYNRALDDAVAAIRALQVPFTKEGVPV